jgi:hypothetical protein
MDKSKAETFTQQEKNERFPFNDGIPQPVVKHVSHI